MELLINKRDITIPEEVIRKWQSIVNIMAELIDVPTALIMKVDLPYIEVFRSSESSKNPYKAGGREHLTGLYCEQVIKTRSKLLVPNALKDKHWDKNPDIKLGMISYLGFPLLWPDDEVFGTICVLDLKENRYSKTYEQLMLQFKELVEAHLGLLYDREHLEDLVEGRTTNLQKEIAERKQAEQELRATNQQLRVAKEQRRSQNAFLTNVLEALAHPFYVVDAKDYTVKLANSAANFGPLTKVSTCYALSHNSRKPCHDAEHPCPLKEVKKTKKPVTVEHIHYDKDGNPQNVEIHAYPIFDSAGKLSEMIEYCLEITERKKVEEQIWRKTTVVEAINNVFQETLVCETEEQVAYTCISMAEELTGSKYGLIGEVNEAGRFDTISYGDLGWAICKMPESKAISLSKNMELRGIWAQAILKEKSQIVNNPTSHPDSVGTPEGHPPITSFLGVPLKHAGKTIGMIGLANKEGGYEPSDQEAIESLSVAFVEALHRKRVEGALREGEEKFRGFAQLSPVGLFIADADGNPYYWNKRLCKIAGMSTDEIKGKGWLRSVHPEDRELVSTKWSQSIRKRSDYTLEHRFIDRHGKVTWAIVQAVAQKDASGEAIGYIGTITDITERKKAEHALENLNKELEATVKKLTLANRELQHFAHVAAHDLKAPLRAIGTLADWISTDYTDKFDKQGKREVELLIGRVARMSDMIDSILRYSESGRVIKEKEKVNLNLLIEEVIVEIAPPENISITVENELPVVEGEKTHFVQVLQNLLSNAVKYMDKPEGQIKVGCIEENGFWEFSVADNGPGVEKEYFEKIFEIFQTLSPRDEFEATGIGLSIVKKIVELYGGSIWVESEFGEGSVFFFTLPNQEMKVADDAKLQANIVS